ncbi:MAG: CPBP family intramembrane metalloprotease, partial [Bacteroidetes bacterium CG18_big_fil_WC_8_21_14_2_50_41_14]
MTQYLIPFLSRVTGQETILFWFIVAGLGIFTPLIIAGMLILKFEGCEISKSTWAERLRFRKITKTDLIWSIVGLVLVGVLSGIILKVLELIIGKF